MEKLNFINKQMEALGVPYEFMQWSSDIAYPYFVGELTEDSVMTSDGLRESTLIITGFHRGSFIDLESVKNKIKNHFHPEYGLQGWTDSGAIVVFYDGSFYVPIEDGDLRRIQINLKIKEWKVS